MPLTPTLSPLVPRGEKEKVSGGCIKMHLDGRIWASSLFGLLNRRLSGKEWRATMRKLITVSVLAALAAGSGCRKKESAPTAPAAVSSDILAGYHFVGTAPLANNSNAAKLREIRALPETRKFEEQTLQKLAHAPKVFYGGSINAEQDERGAALLPPLLDDLIRSESFLQVRGPG